MTVRSMRSGIRVSSGFGLNALTGDEVRALHYATLEVLRDVGIRVESEVALEIFHGAGAWVERIGGYGMVRFPANIIEDCIRWAPSTTVYYGRAPVMDFQVEPHRVGFSTFGECVQVIDPQTREVRSATKQDLGRATLMCDYLDEIAVVERAMGSLDFEARIQPLHNYQVMVTHTSKHIFLGFNSAENTRRLAEMAAACVGGWENFRKRPPLTALVCPTSPLALGEMCCDVIIECAGLGIGIAPISMVQSGVTAPATIAGSLVVHNAEVLSAIVLAQLTARGMPCTYASSSTMMDLRTFQPSLGAPEYGLMSTGLTKLAQYYQLPCWVGGGHSDSKLPDAQAAYESAQNATVAALAGANIIYGVGCLESGLTFDFAKLLMDSEQLRELRHILKGIDISDASMAVDVIRAVGPGGEFMTQQHTFEHMRTMSQAELFDRRKRAAWMKKTGGRDLTERAYAEALKILDEHRPYPLIEGADELMQAIIDEEQARM